MNSMHFVYDVMGAAAVIYDGTTYYLRNAMGDITGIVDSPGTQVISYTYDARGMLLGTAGTMAAALGQDNPPRYRGYVYDTETGLYYLTSRYYNPERCGGSFLLAGAVGAAAASSAAVPERISYLSKRCAEDLHISENRINLCPGSLPIVWRWFLNIACAEESELNGIQLGLQTEYIVRDIGMYLCEYDR